MNISELVRAYWRLWFPPMPEEQHARDSFFVASFVKEHAQGNISLQSGKFLTRESHNAMIDGLRGHHFS